MQKIAKVSVMVMIAAALILGTPGLTSAQSNDQIVAQLKLQIEQLQAQVQMLQQKLSGITGTQTTPAVETSKKVLMQPQPGIEVNQGQGGPMSIECIEIRPELIKGKADVKADGDIAKLQKILATDPEVYPEGKVTGYYGTLTEKAVARFQMKQMNTPASDPTVKAVTIGANANPVAVATKVARVCSKPAYPPKPKPVDAPFNILSPNGGETLTKLSTQQITWSVATPQCPEGAMCMPKQGRYEITLVPKVAQPVCKDASVSCPMTMQVRAPYVIAKNVEGYGKISYNWIVGNTLQVDGSTQSVSDGEYLIRICEVGTWQCDMSDTSFKIVSVGTTPSATITPAPSSSPSSTSQM